MAARARMIHSLTNAAGTRLSSALTHSSSSFPSSLLTSHRQYHVSSFLRNTTATPDAKPSGEKPSEKADETSEKESSNKDEKSESSADDAGAEFQDTQEPPKKRKGLRVAATILGGAGFLYLLFQGHLSNGVSAILEKSFIENLKKEGAAAIPEPGSWAYAFLSPNLLGATTTIGQLMLDGKHLDKLIEGLRISGLETSTMGVSSEALDLVDMVRVNWLLTLMTAAVSNTVQAGNHDILKALRAAHARSVAKRDEFDVKWSHADVGSAFRRDIVIQHLRSVYKKAHSGADISAEELNAQLEHVLSTPETLAAIQRAERPMSVLDLLIQHGMHLKPKETPTQLEEEVKAKFWKAHESKFEEQLKHATSESERTRLLSAEYQTADRAKSERDLEKMLESVRPLFQRVITEQVEKTINLNSWTLLRLMAEPPHSEGNGLLYGKAHAADIEYCQSAMKVTVKDQLLPRKKDLADLKAKESSASTSPEERAYLREACAKLEADIAFFESQVADLKTIVDLRRELLQRWLLPICFVVTSTTPGTQPAMAKWGIEASSTASELLGSVLFDIPDLGPTFKRAPQIVQNALFSAMANLSAVYAEGNYPGGAVYASELVIQCDPNNVQVLTTLATEKLKLGLAQQQYELRQSGGVVSPDPRLNPYLNDALSTLRHALELDPKHLDANFNFLKLLVASGERDTKVLASAADRLIQAVRHAPTTLEPTGLAALPGQSAESLAPLAETTPQLSPSYNLLIRTLEQLNRLDEAAELALEWSYRAHADALSHYTLGRLALREGDLDQAVASLKTAYDLDPAKPETLYQLALAKYKKGDLDEAEQYVNDSLKARAAVQQKVRDRVNQQLLATALSNPTQGPPSAPQFVVANTIPSVHLLRAKIASKRGERDVALAALAEFAKEKPLATEGLILRAKLLQQDGRHREAYSTFTRLVKVWQHRVTATVTVVDSKQLKKSKGKKEEVATGAVTPNPLVTKPVTTRKQYFDDRRHARERAIYDQLIASCQKPADKVAAAQWAKNYEELEFKTMCQEVDKLKNIK